MPGAKITITNKDTGRTFKLETTSTGAYNSGALVAGNYTVRVEVANFKTTETAAVVQVGQITTTDVKLELGSGKVVVEVSGAIAQVNTQQATVQDVLTAKEIEELPVNGRNFLDLATLEPGVQIQDGATFDPTKNGFSSISFGGRFGRTARIELDGLDISDETVGTTTQNIPQSSIQQFQVSQSTLDLSTELTSSGTVNVVTRPGTNTLHGQAFYYGRSDQTSARIAPQQLDFGRKQFGGNLGGWFIKNKLFYFGDVERTDQTLANPVLLGGDFASSSGSFGAPFTEREYVGKLDWNIKPGWTAFYRFSYNQNHSVRGFNPGVYQPFANVDYAAAHAMGTDFTTGRFTHTIRFGYLKFRNAIADAVAGSSIYNPAPGLSINITPSGSDVTCLAGGEEFCSGTNILAPQATFQSNKQFKYDGSYTFGRHILRYGVGYNKILGGGFAKFFGIAPAVSSVFGTDTEAFASAGTFTCPNGTKGASCPLNWPVDTVILGNGQGFFTEIPQFGLPAGGQFDSRFHWYVGDAWKARPNFTLTYGLHYGRDTGRTDSDLAPIPALSVFNNQFFSGLEKGINLPNKNFGPQLGIAWDPWKNGKTVIRAGGGIYYENAIFNNVLFDRPGRLPKGLFAASVAPCFLGASSGVPGTPNPTYCGKPIGAVANDIIASQQAYQAASAAASSNPSFVPASGFDNTLVSINLFAPNYRSPYSVQMNVGVQRQLGHGTVLTVDYVRNVGLHYLMAVDTNKVGDARFLNKTAALAAINTTNASFSCPAGTAGINCAIAAGATIADYAGNGLDSGGDLTSGAPCPFCAFPGINASVGQNQMLFPIGRSVYNGMLVSLKSNLDHPFRGMRRLSLVTSYTLSRFKSLVLDQDFINVVTDNNKPLAFFGPSALDRTHQVGVGATMDFPFATRIALITHWGTAGPVTLLLPTTGTPGEIFRTDVTGDGTVGDVVPGTNIGSFGRSVKAGDINNLINSYNSGSAGQLTPAGQALVSAGLFTAAQLKALGAVTPTLALAPPGQVGVSPGFTFDIHAAWELKPGRLFHAIPERVVIEPQVALFNLFNYQNHDPFGNVLSGVLNGAVGTANGTTAHGPLRRSNLITPGSSSGVNWYLVPRQAQFGVKLIF